MLRHLAKDTRERGSEDQVEIDTKDSSRKEVGWLPDESQEALFFERMDRRPG